MHKYHYNLIERVLACILFAVLSEFYSFQFKYFCLVSISNFEDFKGNLEDIFILACWQLHQYHLIEFMLHYLHAFGCPFRNVYRISMLVKILEYKILIKWIILSLKYSILGSPFRSILIIANYMKIDWMRTCNIW